MEHQLDRSRSILLKSASCVVLVGIFCGVAWRYADFGALYRAASLVACIGSSLLAVVMVLKAFDPRAIATIDGDSLAVLNWFVVHSVPIGSISDIDGPFSPTPLNWLTPPVVRVVSGGVDYLISGASWEGLLEFKLLVVEAVANRRAS